MAHIPTPKQLKYLCTVARLKHFGKAAQACHVSQSTLSAGILELEDSLGVALLERSKKQVLLTAVGEDVVRRAQHILTALDDLVAAVATTQAPLSGRIRLGVIPTIAPFFLPGLLPKLREIYPQLQLLIREDLTGHLVDALQEGEVDVLLLALPFAARNLETRHLFFDRFLLACPGSHPLAGKTPLHVRELRDYEILLLEDGHCLRDHALEACKLRSDHIAVPFEATSLHTIVQMVDNGVGITLLPEMALGAGILAGTRLQTGEFADRKVERSIGLAWRRHSPQAEDFRLLGDFIKQYAQPKPDR